MSIVLSRYSNALHRSIRYFFVLFEKLGHANRIPSCEIPRIVAGTRAKARIGVCSVSMISRLLLFALSHDVIDKPRYELSPRQLLISLRLVPSLNG